MTQHQKKRAFFTCETIQIRALRCNKVAQKGHLPPRNKRGVGTPKNPLYSIATLMQGGGKGQYRTPPDRCCTCAARAICTRWKRGTEHKMRFILLGEMLRGRCAKWSEKPMAGPCSVCVSVSLLVSVIADVMYSFSRYVIPLKI